MSDSYDNSVLMKSLPDDLRETLIRSGIERQVDAGSTIFFRGEAGTSMFIIRTGRVEVSVTAMNGRKSVMNYMGPGEVVGEIAMLDRGARSADVTAVEPVTALFLTRQDVAAFLEAHPSSALPIIGEICAKARNASDMFESQAQLGANIRLARCLLRIAEKWGQPADDGSIHVQQSFSQSDLGEFSGLARENVNRHIKAWTDAGIVQLNQTTREVTIHAPAQLAEIAEL